MPATPPIIQRPTARVLVLDPADRILLFFGNLGYSLEPQRRPDATGFWMLPGGGVDPGETHVVAAVREMREETGMIVPPTMPCIARRDYTYAWKGQTYHSLERIYLHRTDSDALDTSGWAEMDRRWMSDLGWWTFEALAATEDIVRPPGLIPLAAAILAGSVPAGPVDLPGHS